MNAHTLCSCSSTFATVSKILSLTSSKNTDSPDYLFFLPKYREVSPRGTSNNDSEVK